MAALNNQLPENMPADQLPFLNAAALRQAEETEKSLYELFPFGLVHETLQWATAKHGAPEARRDVTPAQETSFPAALP